MLYILTSTETILKVDVRVQESRIGDSIVEGVLNLKLKQTLTAESFKDQQAYLTASTTAAYVSFNKLDQRHRFRASVNLLACNNETYNFTQGSSSSGLGYALACFDAWWRINLQKSNSFAHPVFATGEVLTSGHIKVIGHIVEKLESTYKYVEQNQNTISSFYLFYPQENDKDIPESLRKRLKSLGGILIPSERLQHTLGQLLGDAYDGDPLGRWQPFKGLKSFDYEDSVRFFGRDKDVERLYSDIKQNSGLLVVSGASGTGKSSLIKAGLIPKLEQEHDGLHWAYCTPNALKEKQGVLRFILEQLLIAWDIKKHNIDELVSALNHSIEKGITSLSSLVTPDTKQCLLYLDQYEEVFSQSAQDIDDIGSELSIIDGLAKAFPALNIVLAIRNEYLGRLLDNQALRSPIISNVASQLTSQEWEAIVHEQALFSGITFEQQDENNEALDTIIIEEAIKTPYALPMVSFLLEQLYNQAIEENTNATILQHKHYQALGGLTGAIAYRASTVLQESEASEKTTSTFFDYFVGVNPEGLPFARCVELADIESNKALSNLVKGFIDANLIVSVTGDTDSSAVKLAHDSLFTHWDALTKWIVDSKEYLLWRYSIDGQFTRWQQAITNKADYLLKDKRVLKEVKTYFNLNLINDRKINEYLRSSLKQKYNKQLKVFYICILILIASIGFMVDKQLPFTHILEIQRVKLTDYSCEVEGSLSSDRFVILVSSWSWGENLSNTFCNNESFSKQFGEVYAHWDYTHHDFFNSLYRGDADIAFIRPQQMDSFNIQDTYGYIKVAEYRSYKSFFISRKEMPQLSQSYFLNKRIGLISKKTSRSGFILPLQKLKELELDIDDLDIIYASSHYQLRELIKKGEVDIIASYWSEDDTSWSEKKYAMNISPEISGSAWYIKSDKKNRPLNCMLVKTLKEWSKTLTNKYFKDIVIMDVCKYGDNYEPNL